MTITRVGTRGPSNNAAGAVNVAWGTAPTAGNTCTLHVFALTGQSLPATISGWTTVFTSGSGAGYVSALYKRTATGAETGNQTVLTATVASIAWINEYSASVGGSSVDVVATAVAADTNDGGDGFTATTASLATVAGDVLELGNVFALSTPSFPTVPAAQATRTISQSGATIGTINSRASTTWQTNHRYGVADAAVTTGATAAIVYNHNTTTASMRGLANVAVLREVAAGTPPTSAVTGPSSAVLGATYTVTDASVANTGGATIASRVWRIVSGGGSLSSTTTANPTVTAPSTATTQVVGITATDSNGLVGTEAMLSVTVTASLAASPDRIVTNTGGWAGGGTATDLLDGMSDSSEWGVSTVSPSGASFTVGFPALSSTDASLDFYVQLMNSTDTAAATAGETGTLTWRFYSGTTPITAAANVTVTGTEARIQYSLTPTENAAFTAAGRTDPRIVFTATAA